VRQLETSLVVIKNYIPYQVKEKPYELTIVNKLSSNYRDK